MSLKLGTANNTLFSSNLIKFLRNKFTVWIWRDFDRASSLTLNLLMTTIVAPASNARKWQMGFNSAFKGLRIMEITTKYLEQSLLGTSKLHSPSYFKPNGFYHIYLHKKKSHAHTLSHIYLTYASYLCRSLCPRGLRLGSAADRLLRLRARIPPGGHGCVCLLWVFCVVRQEVSASGCITRPKEPYRVCCVWSMTVKPNNEAALAH